MILSFLTLLVSFNVFSQMGSGDFDIIQNPATSKRCKALIAERNDKIVVSQKLKSILKRNTELQKKLRESQKLLEQKLLINRNSARRELTLALTQIETMEENIVRSGCPGVSL